MASTAQIIDLISSDDETSTPNKHKKRSGGFSRSKRGKKRAKRDNNADTVVFCLDWSDDENEDIVPVFVRNNDKEEEIVQVAPPVAAYKTDKNEEKNKTVELNQDEDLAVVGPVFSALADYPHAREDCVTHPYSKDPKRHCSNCFCFVCDTLASSCPVWQTHCHATNKSSKWRMLREQVRKNGGVLPVAAPPVPRPPVRRRTTASTTARTARPRQAATTARTARPMQAAAKPPPRRTTTTSAPVSARRPPARPQQQQHQRVPPRVPPQPQHPMVAFMPSPPMFYPTPGFVYQRPPMPYPPQAQMQLLQMQQQMLLAMQANLPAPYKLPSARTSSNNARRSSNKKKPNERKPS